MEQNRILAFKTGKVFSDEELMEIQGGIAVDCPADKAQTIPVCKPGNPCDKATCDDLK